MQLFSRAGLVVVIISSALTLISAAPVPIINGSPFSLSAHGRRSSTDHSSPEATLSTKMGVDPLPKAGRAFVLDKRARKPPKAAAPKRAAAPQQQKSAAPKQRAAPMQRAAAKQKAVPKQRAAPEQKAAQKNSPAKTNSPKPRHKSIGEKFREFGHKVKAHFQGIGHKIKEGFQKFGAKVKKGFQTFAAKAKVGFQKVGHFIKTTGAKIAKFGLKILSTVEEVAAKVVKFIPGVGQVLSKGLEATSFGTNKASDAIHVSLGAKLDRGMKVMSKIRKYADYVPRDLLVVEFDERDDVFNWDFEERDFMLDNNEGMYLE